MKTSVALCTYNGEKYIKEQLYSIIYNTEQPSQIVVCDDGSTDKTVDIVREVLENSGIEFLLIVNEKNMGIDKNFEQCFNLCNGDIIFPCDQDNVWKKEYIAEFQKIFSENENLLFAFCNGYVTDENLNVLYPIWQGEEELLYKNLDTKETKRKFLRGCIQRKYSPHGHTTAIRREFLQKIQPSMFFYDGWTSLCAAATMKILYIDKKLVCFRRHIKAASNAGLSVKEASKNEVMKRDHESYFSYPTCYSVAYQRFLDLFETELYLDDKELALQYLEFHKKVAELKDLNLLSRISVLFKLYKKGIYEVVRGNRNSFIMDCIYLIKSAKF